MNSKYTMNSNYSILFSSRMKIKTPIASLKGAFSFKHDGFSEFAMLALSNTSVKRFPCCTFQFSFYFIDFTFPINGDELYFL